MVQLVRLDFGKSCCGKLKDTSVNFINNYRETEGSNETYETIVAAVWERNMAPHGSEIN